MKNNYLLSIESSSKICSISISQKEQILLEYTIAIPNSHDLFLAQLTYRALNDLQIKVEDLSCVAISSGPGSFTGLRIGGAFAKGLCFDNSVKLVPVPTLFALAYQMKELPLEVTRIISVVHSHKNLFFVQIYDSGVTPISEVKFQALEEILENIYEDDLVVGFGAEEFQKGKQFKELNYLTASKVAKLGWKLFEEGKFVNSEEFVPSYFLEFQPKTKN